jgi:hypothetical protein
MYEGEEKNEVLESLSRSWQKTEEEEEEEEEGQEMYEVNILISQRKSAISR